MEADNRKRLGRLVIARRTELGMRTTKALAEQADLSPRMLGDVENGRRENFSAGAKAQIERALQWQPGSIDAALAGDNPTSLTQAQWQDSSSAPVSAKANSDEGMRHVLDHTWGTAEEFADELLAIEPPDSLLHAARMTLGVFGGYLADHLIRYDANAEDRDRLLAELYRRRDSVDRKLSASNPPAVVIRHRPDLWNQTPSSPSPEIAAASEGHKDSDDDDDGGVEPF